MMLLWLEVLDIDNQWFFFFQFVYVLFVESIILNGYIIKVSIIEYKINFVEFVYLNYFFICWFLRRFKFVIFSEDELQQKGDWFRESFYYLIGSVIFVVFLFINEYRIIVYFMGLF